MLRFAPILCLLAAAPAAADTLLGGELGVHYWSAGAEGAYGDSDDLTDFNFDDANTAVLSFALEHPVPLLPNLKLRHNPLETSGQATLDQGFSLSDTTFPAGTSVATHTDFTHTDLVFYYEVLDNSLIALDLGANLKWFDGRMEARSTSLPNMQASRDFAALVPMLYGRLRADLWGTGFYGAAEANYLSLDQSKLSDIQFALGYALIDGFAFALNLEAGYRAFDLRVNDVDNLYTNLQFNGAWLGVALDF